jgi:hypothetical protein
VDRTDRTVDAMEGAAQLERAMEMAKAGSKSEHKPCVDAPRIEWARACGG